MATVTGRAVIGGQSRTVTAAVTLPVAPAPGAITHGRQLTRDMCLPRVPLTTVTTEARTSQLGTVITGKWFKARVRIEGPVKFVDCRFDQPLDTNPSYPRVELENCLVSPTSVGDWAAGPSNIHATRCAFEGCSDGIRYDNTDLIECWIRCKLQSQADHNDGVQCYMASKGGSTLRCNIDVRPVGQTAIMGNGAFFVADNSRGEYVVRDNWFAGGGYTMRLHESGTYRVTGNVVEKGSWIYGPLTTTNAIAGAFKEWSGNTLSDGTPLNR